MAACALEAVEPALHQLERAADLAAQELGAGRRAARAMLALREQLGGVLRSDEDLLAKVVVVNRIGKLAAEIDHAAQRAPIGSRPAIAVDDPLQGCLLCTRALDVRIAHGVLASIVSRSLS